jgi:hypothetical protein
MNSIADFSKARKPFKECPDNTPAGTDGEAFIQGGREGSIKHKAYSSIRKTIWVLALGD